MLKISELIEVTVIATLAALPLVVVAIFFYGLSVIIWPSPSCGAEYLGRVGGNPFSADSCDNPFSKCGNPFNPDSPKNPFGRYGNPYSPYAVNNPYGRGLMLYGDDGGPTEE